MTTKLDFKAEFQGEPLDHETLIKKPWISPSGEKFPLKLRLILKRKSAVEQIKIVAHNELTPQEVVISTAENEPNGAEKVLGTLRFNADSNGKYELKTIYLDVTCTSIILSIQKGFERDVGKSGQVGLAEVQVLGRYEMNMEQPEVLSPVGDQKITLEDGRFTAEIDELLQRVEKNKQRSAQSENFGLATTAQLRSQLLTKARGEMEQLERDQRSAISEEDFHRALDLQQEMKILRGNVLAA
ncbi:unnamed protein product, partial [Strongylus vulgaris]